MLGYYWTTATAAVSVSLLGTRKVCTKKNEDVRIEGKKRRLF
jgi:hypothetical protein